MRESKFSKSFCTWTGVLTWLCVHLRFCCLLSPRSYYCASSHSSYSKTFENKTWARLNGENSTMIFSSPCMSIWHQITYLLNAINPQPKWQHPSPLAIVTLAVLSTRRQRGGILGLTLFDLDPRVLAVFPRTDPVPPVLPAEHRSRCACGWQFYRFLWIWCSYQPMKHTLAVSCYGVRL